MSQIIENVEAHYETHEVPFGRVYEWHKAHVILECDCGEKCAFVGTSTITTCRGCGADYAALVHDIHYREGRLRGEKVKTQAREVVELLEQARKLMAEDSVVQPAMDPLHVTLHESEVRATMLEDWYERTYLSV